MECKLNTYQDTDKIKKQQFQLNANRKDRLLVQIHHTVPGPKGQIRLVRFILLACSEHKEQIVAIDHRGNIFIVDLSSNKFWLLVNIGICSVVDFVPNFPSDLTAATILTGTKDGVLHFINTETGVESGSLKGHSSEVKQLSFSTEHYCLSLCKDEAIIWDLRTRTQAYKLTLQIDIGIKQVLFIPISNNILACFKDDSMHIWEYETFESIKQILPSASRSRNVQAIAFTKDGRAMIYGGQSKSVIMFSLDTWSFINGFVLPDSIEGILDIQFIPQAFDGGANKIVAVLSNKRTMHIIDMENCEHLVELTTTPVSRFSCTPNGKYLACVLRSGEINVYNVGQLIKSTRAEDIPFSKITAEKSSSKNFIEMNKSLPKVAPKEIKQKTGTVSKARSNVEIKFKRCEDVTSTIDENKHTQTQHLKSVQDEIKKALSLDKLHPILQQFGEYPEKYRTLIWRNLLHIPCNQHAYTTLVQKATHPAFKNLNSQYPLKNKTSLKTMKRALSCLAHWSPLFSEVEYIPLLIFPFAKMFEFDPLIGFEVLITILINFCQYWFEYYPLPPINILLMIENILSEHDGDLLNHYCNLGITSQHYAWPLLEVGFSEVLDSAQWLKLWDNILSNEPSFLIAAVVSYNTTLRADLKQLDNADRIKDFFHTQNPINMKKMLSQAYHLCENTSDKNHPRQYFKPFTALGKVGGYPIFDQYPKVIIDYQADQMNKIREEKDEIEKLEEEGRRKEAEHEAMLRNSISKEEHERRLGVLENKYRSVLQQEEKRLAERQMKMSALRRALRKKEMEMLAETRTSIIKANTSKRQMELWQLLDDIERKKVREGIEQEAIEEEMHQHYKKLLNRKDEIETRLRDSISDYHTPEHSNVHTKQKHLQDRLLKIHNENEERHQDKYINLAARLTIVDSLLQKAKDDITCEISTRQYCLEPDQQHLKTIELEAKTKELENQVEELLNAYTELQKNRHKGVKDRVRRSKRASREMSHEHSGLINIPFNHTSNLDEQYDNKGSKTSRLDTNSDPRQDSQFVFESTSATFNSIPIYGSAGYKEREKAVLSSIMDLRRQLVKQLQPSTSIH